VTAAARHPDSPVSNDQVEACRRVFASDTRWTVVRGSELEEGASQVLPVWSRHVGDPILASNITRREDFALFMVAALEDDALIHEAPAIVGCRTLSALAHLADACLPAGWSLTVSDAPLLGRLGWRWEVPSGSATWWISGGRSTR
jgi:hypothetical protein